MTRKRIGADKTRDKASRMKALKAKHAGKTKSQLNNADVFEFAREIMANKFDLPD